MAGATTLTAARPTALRQSVTAAAAAVLLLALMPVVTALIDDTFLLTILTRVLILGIAASSLGFLIGHGGMVSFGHALYLGLGSYAVGIPMYYGLSDGFLHLALALACSAVAALFVGLIALRTRGVFFIMITLALAQMFYFIGASLSQFGGDDGLSLERRSDFSILGVDWLDLHDGTTFYLVCLAVLAATLVLQYRVMGSRFGRVVRGCMDNEKRMRALGFDTFRHKLIAFIYAGAVCGLAGFLLANHVTFVSPDAANWLHSGELMIMVIVGGLGMLIGPAVGAFVFVFLEYYLSQFSENWPVFFGLFLILVVLYGRGGIVTFVAGLPARLRARG